MNRRKVLYKKPNEEFDKIITNVELDNFERAVKGEIQWISVGGEGYHILVNKDSNEKDFEYNITIAIKSISEIEYKDIYGNLLIVKLNDDGKIIDLVDEELFDLVKTFCFNRK